MRRSLLAAVAGIALAAPTTPLLAQGRTHAVIVVGLGGEDRYRERFHSEAKRIYEALVQRHGIPAENVTYLGERVEIDPDLIAMRSTRENVLQVLADIAQKAQPMDRLLIVLIGHGTAERDEPQFNLPGPDITPSDLDVALSALPTQTIALVHTGTASGGFIEPLSGPNRILVAATRTERQLNATEFDRFFADAIADDGADLDHDDRVSMLEAFQYAKQEVARYYEEENEMLTENAVLDDNGDGEGSEDAGPSEADGPLAATFQLGGVSGTAAQVPDDAALAALYQQRNEIQGRIAELRARKDTMTEDDYLDAMEDLLVELALKNREIRAREGGGG